MELVWNVFLEFEAIEYPKQGVEEFKRYIMEDNILQMLDKKEIVIWGCFDRELVGMIAGRIPDHITLLFVDKRYHRQGIAKQLFQIMKDDFINTYHIDKITVNSSLYAKEVYKRLGFYEVQEVQVVNGIPFISMQMDVGKV
ncbi:ribosomal protein S18 acetylase RimI-like enzyme [Breznakia sp. PF5-3]|uniref:GNAT family N-acetyltransferase n=1 Tax=unclassified Breznakia TaxID=2623764 RepID=UPI002406513F|nr:MULTISPECIES: GNAT family N-acetyltransferase [unclassified Breznakia]MDL2276228.1 GNAT family N-acetyltransferase [Breznakia sp. OttesenSCG-928-G09]MDF9824886.1 ribosomal protein S18 acetylase RimI-like enzyme [Breznakia sp. PM6-1]MDF9835615.1 ribosomal protein S18 acetylase RimI-like enzyme [Breznakia sp. PF5-3]MDF9837969.1 ribosomal protein S18 acetylase RimI-like enzyme [Breznakia sp. PFB2-8]MDF9859958.1 ribosomal protein S18 acetylase RimI-like enzyme [Breznakia sp. PH5-24]